MLHLLAKTHWRKSRWTHKSVCSDHVGSLINPRHSGSTHLPGWSSGRAASVWFNGFPAFRTMPSMLGKRSLEYILFSPVSSQTTFNIWKDTAKNLGNPNFQATGWKTLNQVDANEFSLGQKAQSGNTQILLLALLSLPLAWIFQEEMLTHSPPLLHKKMGAGARARQWELVGMGCGSHNSRAKGIFSRKMRGHNYQWPILGSGD